MGEPPLKGLRAIEFGQLLAGPYVGTLLGDFGADVIKVEPLDGDPYRRSYAQIQPLPKYNHGWVLGARNKRSLAVDLKSSAGRDVLYRLLDSADVFITNLPPTARRRLGIGYEDVGPTRPRLI